MEYELANKMRSVFRTSGLHVISGRNTDTFCIPSARRRILLDIHEKQYDALFLFQLELNAVIADPGFDMQFRDSSTAIEWAAMFHLVRDIEIGHPNLDPRLLIRGSDASAVCEVLDDHELLEWIDQQLYLNVRIQRGWLGGRGPHSLSHCQLHCQGDGGDWEWVVRCVRILERLLDRVDEYRCARWDPVEKCIHDVHLPRGPETLKIADSFERIWDAAPIRTAAAKHLAKLADPRGLEALEVLLEDPAVEIRTLAVAALRTIANDDAVPLLVAQLYRAVLDEDERRPIDEIHAALVDRGHEPLVRAFHETLAGDPSGLHELLAFGEAANDALIGVVDHGTPTECVHVALACADASIRAALPAMRRAHRRIQAMSVDGPAELLGHAKRLQDAIDKLSRRDTLPRSAQPAPERTRLPSKPQDDLPDEQLPKQSSSPDEES